MLAPLGPAMVITASKTSFSETVGGSVPERLEVEPAIVTANLANDGERKLRGAGKVRYTRTSEKTEEQFVFFC